MRVGPADADDVGDSEAVADEEARGALLEVGLHDAVEAARLVYVTVDAVRDLLGRITCFCQNNTHSNPRPQRESRATYD